MIEGSHPDTKYPTILASGENLCFLTASSLAMITTPAPSDSPLETKTED